MVLQLLNPNNVKVYNVSAGKSIPDWMVQKKKADLKHDEGKLYRGKRVEPLNIMVDYQRNEEWM
jgi:hypothetical protein